MGADISVPTQRGHQSSAGLPFRADRTDVIGLLCVRPAVKGGTSLLASAWAVHDLLAERDPELLAVLYRPLPQDFRGEQLPGEAPWATIPVFAHVEGHPSRATFVDSSKVLNVSLIRSCEGTPVQSSESTISLLVLSASKATRWRRMALASASGSTGVPGV